MATAASSPEATQQKQRRYALYTDQHGRRWGGNIDKRTGHPVSPKMDHRFDAPWLPNPKYVRILPDAAMEPNRVQIHYDEAVADLEAARAKYDALILNTGLELHGQAFDETQPTNAVRQRVGPPPVSAEPYRLAGAGNTYLLGLEPFAETNPDHVAAATAIGKRVGTTKARTKGR